MCPVNRLLAAVLFAAVLSHSVAAESRLYIAAQYGWGDRLGFYLDLEGDTLAELPLIVGAADGENWRFARHVPGFQPGRAYDVRAVVGPSGSQLFLDGELVAGLEGGMRPAAGPLQISEQPGWARITGDWIPELDSVRVSLQRDGAVVQRRDFAFEPIAHPALLLFEYPYSDSASLATLDGDTVIIDARITFHPRAAEEWAPLIDPYGQCVYADWPEKVRSDEELVADKAREDALLTRMPPSPDFDRFGGYLDAGWTEEPTGFFRTVRREGHWWLISPEGNPCFYTGACGLPGNTWPATPVSEREDLFEWLPPKEEPWSGARGANYWGRNDGTEYVCFYSANLIRKYGPAGWKEANGERTVRRIRAWGFSGAAKWGGYEGLVSTPVLHRWGTPNLVEHPDIWDPEVRARFRREIEAQVIPRRNDPYVLGWSLGNEYDEIIKPDEIREILTKPDDTPAKKALVAYLAGHVMGASTEQSVIRDDMLVLGGGPAFIDVTVDLTDPSVVERLRLHYAREYYRFIYEAVKAADPNHLYLGFWIVPGWWVNESDWTVSAPFCDVIGYDRYSDEYEDDRLRRLKAQTDKPVFCGEYSFPPFYGGRRGLGRYGVIAGDDADAGRKYIANMRAAAADPYNTGVCWFTWHDQPLTGRGPGRGPELVIGEHFAFGPVTETDRPKWELVRAMREANLQAARWRLEAMAK